MELSDLPNGVDRRDGKNIRRCAHWDIAFV